MAFAVRPLNGLGSRRWPRRWRSSAAAAFYGAALLAFDVAGLRALGGRMAAGAARRLDGGVAPQFRRP